MRTSITRKTVSALVLSAITLPALAASGAFDTTFNGTGKKKVDFGAEDSANSIIQLQDGTLVAVGEFYDSMSSNTDNNQDIAIVRLKANGGMDTTFNGTGKKKIDTGVNEAAMDVIQQQDGKLVVAGGLFDNTASTESMFVARLNPGGSFDTTFNGTGKKTVSIGGDGQALSVIQQADGKLVLVGYLYAGIGQDMIVVRLKPNGGLDTTFNGTGKLTIDLGGFDTAHDVIQQSNGKLVIVGETTDVVTGASNLAVVRLNTNGSMDTGFGSGGSKVFDFGANESAMSVVQQSDGKLVVVGQTYNPTTFAFDMLALRLNSGGGLDTSFGSGGKKVINMGDNENAHSVVLQPDGKLVLAGSWMNADGMSDIAVVRLNTDGSFDTTFGSTGKKKFNMGQEEQGTCIIRQADGNLVVAGAFDDAPVGIHDMAVIRVLP